MKERSKIHLAGITIALSGFLFLISLQSAMRPFAKEGLYVQNWSSEIMMQTVSIADLREAPLETLWNIHIQPPALDSIRAILAHTWTSPDPLTALKQLDYLLYLVWALLYGLLGLVVFLWAFKMAGVRVAFIAAVVILLHPASIYYATMLDSTFLASLLILFMFYLLWKIKNNYNVSITLFAITTVALVFTRSIFQWPFVLVVGLSLFLFGRPRREIFLFLIIAGGVTGLYAMKQYYQFGTFSTSSFTGLNLTRSVDIDRIGAYWSYLDDHSELEMQGKELPRALTRTRKINGATNFNHYNYLELNQQLIDEYVEHILKTPVSQVIKSYLENLRIYFKPSSNYTEHVIVDRIPWRDFYDRIFSYPILVVLILLAGFLWLVQVSKNKDHLASIGLALPLLYIFLVTVLFEKGENMRFKFFIEPVLFVFLISQLYIASQKVCTKVLKKSAASDRFSS